MKSKLRFWNQNRPGLGRQRYPGNCRWTGEPWPRDPDIEFSIIWKRPEIRSNLWTEQESLKGEGKQKPEIPTKSNQSGQRRIRCSVGDEWESAKLGEIRWIIVHFLHWKMAELCMPVDIPYNDFGLQRDNANCTVLTNHREREALWIIPYHTSSFPIRPSPRNTAPQIPSYGDRSPT